MPKGKPYVVTLKYSSVVYAKDSEEAKNKAINYLAMKMIGYHGYIDKMVKEAFTVEVN